MTKSNFMLRDALSRYTSFVGSAATFPSRGRLTVGFCLADRGGAIPPHREKPKNNKF